MCLPRDGLILGTSACLLPVLCQGWSAQLAQGGPPASPCPVLLPLRPFDDFTGLGASGGVFNLGRVKQPALSFVGPLQAVTPSAPVIQRGSLARQPLAPTLSSLLEGGWLEATEEIAHPA